MVPVFRKCESYIEVYVGFLLPLGPRQIKNSLAGTNWASDLERARYKLGLQSKKHFLSGSFRNYHELSRRGDRYLDSDGEWRLPVELMECLMLRT